MQVVYKHGSDIKRIEHIGSAHSSLELEFLIHKAHEHIDSEQPKLDLFPTEQLKGFSKGSYSELLWDALVSQYDALGFTALEDEVFCQLVCSRIIKPASKLDTIRVLQGLGFKVPSYSGINRCLRRVVDSDYRSAIAKCCFEHTSDYSLSLLLYDVTTLYFEAQKEDEYRKPGLSKERRLEPQITIGLFSWS